MKKSTKITFSVLGSIVAGMALFFFFQAQFKAQASLRQFPLSVIGTKTGTTASTSTLPNTFASTTRKSINVAGLEQVVLNIWYSLGNGESSNSLDMRVEYSPDGTNYFRHISELVAKGTTTAYLQDWTFGGTDIGDGTATASSTSYYFRVPLDVADLNSIRVDFREEGRVQGVFTNSSGLYVEATASEVK